MAVYKIPQDVEADDKFVGPLSFKQFIFAGVAAVALYLSFLALTRGFWPVIIFLLPVAIVTGFLAFPWGRDQPTEIWLAARIRFLIKPRRRIWNQAGVKDLVTITVPKVAEKHLTKDFSGEEAKGRLSALATMLDSRGWAIKNSAVNLSVQQAISPINPGDDRLLDASGFPQEVAAVEVTAADDIMDPRSNQVAAHFETMIQQAEREHKQVLQTKISDAREGKPDSTQAADYWFMHQGEQDNDHRQQPTPPPNYVVGGSGQTVKPGREPAINSASQVSPEEEALIKRVKASREQAAMSGTFAHLKTVQPVGRETPANKPKPPIEAPNPISPQPVNPAIIQLAQDNDKNIATLAREAKRNDDRHLPNDEVVVSLH